MIPTTEVVPGDMIFLSLGDHIPADLRVIESANLACGLSLQIGGVSRCALFFSSGRVKSKSVGNFTTILSWIDTHIHWNLLALQMDVGNKT